MSASKKAADGTAHGKFRDLKSRKNPKGGAHVPVINASQLNLGAMGDGIGPTNTAGGVSAGPGSIQKVTDSSSANLFGKCG